MIPYTPPSFGAEAFNCPHRNAYANQIWQQIVQQALQAMSQPTVEVEYTLVNALIESTSKASEYKTIGSLSAARIIGGEIQLSATDKEAGWREIPLATS